MHGLLESFAQALRRDRLASDRVVVAPVAGVEIFQLTGGAVVDMAGRERRDIGAMARQRLHLRGDPQTSVAIVPPIQGTNAERVAGDQIAPLLRIPQGERVDAVEARDAGGALFEIQRVDDLAVGAALECVRRRERALEFAVVVDLAVHGQGQAAIAGKQRLRAAGRIDDGQALVHEQAARLAVDAGPVRPAMALARRKRKGQRTQRRDVGAGAGIEQTEDGTHGRDS